MSRGGFSVTWEHYNKTVCAGLRDLQQRDEFVDMTIAADGHLVRVHQLVVGLASPFLKQLIRATPTPHPVLFLNNVSHRVLCCILEYMYTGEVVVPPDELKTFIATAKALHVRGLDDMIVPESISAKPASPDVVEAASTLENISSQKSQPAAKSDVWSTGEWSTNSKRSEDSVLSSKVSRASAQKQSGVTKIDISKAASGDHLERSPPKRRKLDASPKNIDVDDTSLMSDGDRNYEDDDEENTVKSTLDERQESTREMPQIAYTTSNMGGIQLILNRYIYGLRNKYKDGRRSWQCVNYSPKRCNAVVVTKGNTLVSRKTLHNHGFHDRRIMQKVRNGLVYTSLESMPRSAKNKYYTDDNESDGST